MSSKPDQAAIVTSFHDPEELAAQAAAARAAATAPKDEDKTAEMRPLSVTNVPVGRADGPDAKPR